MENYIHQWERHFTQHRPFLISFAFRMTGSLSEAEDIVQDALLACANVDPSKIENHKSWLTKVCSNKGLDHLKLAYKNRETYHGTWLPDAIPDSLQVWSSLESESPDKNLLLSQSLTTSFLLMIEKLNPEERVVYLLNEIFEYSFKEIASFLQKTEDACRKIAERARKAVASQKAKFNPNHQGAEKLIAQFFDLAKVGNTTAMMELLADESEFWADGGGKVSAAAGILTDNFKIANFFSKLGTSPVFASIEFKMEIVPVNHRLGAVISRKLPSGEWVFESVMSFEVQDGKLARIYAQRNPDKLKALVSALE